MSEKEICKICDSCATYRWTDSHGVGACRNCGAPYLLYHYDDNSKRVDKPAELLIGEDYIALARRYWAEHGRNVAPGYGNFPGSSYEVATQEDFKIFDEWADANFPKRLELAANE